jgi:hypothetical protein
MTKDYLETKRSKALALETTFVYDYPDLFKVNLKDIWKEHVTKCSAPGYISFFNLSNLSTVVCSLLTSFSFTLHNFVTLEKNRFLLQRQLLNVITLAQTQTALNG